MKLFSKLFGTKNDRDLKNMQPTVQAIAALESKVEKRSDGELSSRIAELRTQVDNALKQTRAPNPDDDPGHKLAKVRINGALSPVMEETFAIVREAAKRVVGMRHYDVQMIGGMCLHDGRIAEMRTGEGKTLVATLPAVLNAMAGQGVHVVTVNDYLASRDAEWMSRIYRFLGLTTGVVVGNQDTRSKHEAYASDITYGQNNEFGFDYLRDNMKFSLDDYVQKRGHAFAIIDEVDSILIDEARTPLIISGASDDPVEMYYEADKVAPRLRKDEHYAIDEKARSALLTEVGVEHIERILELDNLYDPANMEILHHITQALRAHVLYKRDDNYVVEAGEVVIVDDHTGRLMHGRRWSDGLHGAVEAKEGVNVQPETQTLATVTFQNFFRMYKKIGGMTGTADTEAEEFAKIYDLDVLVIPTNRPIDRRDEDDLVYKSEVEKVMAVAEDIVETYAKGQPILVGTVSVEKSEVLSSHLKKFKVPHHVLNAKRHRDEANIVAQAGQYGAVTIATNMAGRGTDIILGGNAEYMARTEVAKRLEGDTDGDQVAKYAFLTGRSDLINIEKLADRDKGKGEYLLAYEEKLKANQEARAEAAAAGKSFDAPTNEPLTLEDAQKRVYEDRLTFYRECLKLYDEVLPTFEETCSKEKDKVKTAGGLRCIGTERHESRRIDNQLRGRAGRQGDPGSSRFYLSLEDDLMRVFGSDRMISVMNALGMEDGVPIEHKMVTKSIANAQKRVEGMHFDSRKNVLEYDDVMNQQRKSIYGLRAQVLDADPDREGYSEEEANIKMRELILDLVEECVINSVGNNCPEKVAPGEWNLPAIAEELQALLGVVVDAQDWLRDRDDIMNKAFSVVLKHFDSIDERDGIESRRHLENYLYLQTIDAKWKEHLQHMDHLREGIHMRSYAQKDPKQEYKKEGFQLFRVMRSNVRDEVLEKVFKSRLVNQDDELEQMRQDRAESERQAAERVEQHGEGVSEGGQGTRRTGQPAAARAPAGAFPMASSSMTGPPNPNAGRSAPRPAPSSTGPASNATGLPQRGDADGEGPNRAQRRRQKASKKKRVRLR
ncbi:MAG: preprotein translocase subunit SecA [Deltaproteobacteria bacterium]|nr:preprotein translocase subunit SecA [Deltaproteobacteria bacterium]